MSKKKTKQRKKTGLPPGSIVFTGDQKVAQVDVYCTQYNENKYTETIGIAEHNANNWQSPSSDVVLWYDFQGIHDVELIKEIGEKYHIHALVLEDIASPNQRPKFEEYEQGFFIVTQNINFDALNYRFSFEQIAIYVGHHFVISFQEDNEDSFFDVRQQLQEAKNKIRIKKADFLAYALIDSLVDNYFNVLDSVEDEMNKVESTIIADPDTFQKSLLFQLKREMLTMRKMTTSLRESINRFARSEHHLIVETTEVYIRDLYDHIVQVQEASENIRDTLASLQDLYLAELSFKMNNVMKTLTVVSAIFIPLTFIAGLYGMNFKYMPELEWQNGYFYALGFMFTIFLGMLLYFSRKKWL